jgi:hypothetical protein
MGVDSFGDDGLSLSDDDEEEVMAAVAEERATEALVVVSKPNLELVHQTILLMVFVVSG